MDKRQPDKRFDDLFDQAFEDAVRSGMELEIPDPDASWNKMAAKIARQGRKRRLKKRLQMIGMTAAAFMIGVYLLGKPQETEAFLPVTKFFSEMRSDVVTLFQGDKKKLEQEPEGMLTAPPPEGAGPVMGDNTARYPTEEIIQVTTVEEARKIAKADMPVFGYIPEGYELENIKLYLNSSKMFVSGLAQYKQPAGDGYVHISFFRNPLERESAIRLENGTENPEKLQIGGEEAVFIQSRAKVSYIIWGNSKSRFYLMSNIGKAEMIRIAEGIH